MAWPPATTGLHCRRNYEVFGSDWVIGGALVLYAIEFVADKIPWVDSMWDSVIHSCDPVGGALVAVATLGEASPSTEVLVGLLGGTIAASSHLTKASTRVAANTSPEPFTNWGLSLVEDLFVVGLAYLALEHPVAALVVAAILLALIIVFAAVIVRTVRRWFTRRSNIGGRLSAGDA